MNGDNSAHLQFKEFYFMTYFALHAEELQFINCSIIQMAFFLENEHRISVKFAKAKLKHVAYQ